MTRLTGNPAKAVRIVKPIWPPVRPQPTPEDDMRESEIRKARHDRRIARLAKAEEQKGGE